MLGSIQGFIPKDSLILFSNPAFKYLAITFYETVSYQ